MTPEEFIYYMADKKSPEDRKIFLTIYHESGLSAYDFCYIFPNNMLKMHGIPMRRGGRDYHRHMRRKLIFYMFPPIRKLVKDKVLDTLINGDYYNNFSDVKTIKLGTPNIFDIKP